MAEDVGDEVRQKLGFLELIRAAGGDQLGPMLEPGHRLRDTRRQLERAQLLPEDLRVKQGFGFDGHGLAHPPAEILASMNALMITLQRLHAAPAGS